MEVVFITPCLWPRSHVLCNRVCREQSLSSAWHSLQHGVYDRLRQYQPIFETGKLPLRVLSETSFLLHEHVRERKPSFVDEARCPTPMSENTKKNYTSYLNTICTMNTIPLAFFGKSGEQINAVISEQHYREARVKSTVLNLLSAIFSETRLVFIIIYSTDSSEKEEKYTQYSSL